MGDRTTPMKFGPEWLRNLSREPTSPGSSGASGGNQSTQPIRPVTSIATASSNTTTPPNTSKVLLAKLRLVTRKTFWFTFVFILFLFMKSVVHQLYYENK